MRSTSDNVNVSSFPALLKRWRELRKLSQLELALRARVSQKHVSYLELDRVRPSRNMVLLLADALDLSLHDRNVLLEAAGFAQVFRRRTLDDPAMRPVVQAIELMLRHLNPNPVLVVDGAWDIVRANAGMMKLMSRLAYDARPLARAVGEGRANNMMRLIFHPVGLRGRIANWNDIAPRLLAHLRRGNPGQCGPAGELLEELLSYPDVAALPAASAVSGELPPVAPIEFRQGATRIRLLSMCSIFGNAQDITTDQLRIQSFFPADDEARRALG